MEDLDIIKQLMSENHLEPKEIERAQKLISSLQINILNRVF